MRTEQQRIVKQPELLKVQLLQWAQTSREVVLLDSNHYQQSLSSFDWVMAVEAFTSIKTDYHQAFDDLHQYQSQTKDWLFGYLSYDLKNDTEKLVSQNEDGLEFPDLFFFQPKKIFRCKDDVLTISYLYCCDDEMESDWMEIKQVVIPENPPKPSLTIQQRVSEEDYARRFAKMLDYIQKGTIYEANFCMEFFAEEAVIEPLSVYQELNAISEPPFAVFFKNNEHYLLSASPERYLRKEGNQVYSQPIKGTAKRSANPDEDARFMSDLEQNEKERSENIMIVDLVRNDLSRTASKGTVRVDELCKVYSFKQVHQMISTIHAEVAERIPPVEIIRTTFPMGSMTGAPKIAAMQIIEELEATRRGVYSGAVGYFTPDGDFDFNVVIRSILYHRQNKYLSFSVGSAVTAKANAEAEYAECLLKAKAMRQVLGVN
jgi:para-aminobenzoate synthetase component 1